MCDLTQEFDFHIKFESENSGDVEDTNSEELLVDEKLDLMIYSLKSEPPTPLPVPLTIPIDSALFENYTSDNTPVLKEEDEDYMEARILPRQKPQAVKKKLLDRRKSKEIIRKEHKCQECGKCFQNQPNLNRHLVIHTQQRLFNCHQCGKCFTQRVHLKSHQQTVHEQCKLFLCEKCGKRFNEKSSLNKHLIAAHNSEAKKCFNCPNCKSTFAYKYSLRAHAAVEHEKQDWYKCGDCEKTFTRKIDIKRLFMRRRKSWSASIVGKRLAANITGSDIPKAHFQQDKVSE